ncbi:hypothetical protein E2542_SST27576 [Spatholobus suberectus]|nr:hypothetical protein E2542_SST27576 [Spatholobus suberectus]
MMVFPNGIYVNEIIDTAKSVKFAMCSFFSFLEATAHRPGHLFAMQQLLVAVVYTESAR